MKQHLLLVGQKIKMHYRTFLMWFVFSGGSLTMFQYKEAIYNYFYPKNEHLKDQILSVESLHRDLKDSKIFFVAYLPERTRLTSYWIKNDMGLYETVKHSSNFFYVLPYFYPPLVGDRLIKPNKFMAIPMFSDKNELALTDSFIIDGEKKYMMNNTLPILPDTSPTSVTFGACLSLNPLLVDYTILRHADDPFLPDSIKEPLYFLKSLTYYPTSFEKGISNYPNTLVNPISVLFSNNISFLTDSIKPLTLTYEMRQKDSVDKAINLGQFTDALLMLNGRVYRFLSNNGLNIATE